MGSENPSLRETTSLILNLISFTVQIPIQYINKQLFEQMMKEKGYEKKVTGTKKKWKITNISVYISPHRPQPF